MFFVNKEKNVKTEPRKYAESKKPKLPVERREQKALKLLVVFFFLDVDACPKKRKF